MIGGAMPRAADLVVGGWRLSSILTVQTGSYLTPDFPSGEGDPSGTGSGLNGEYGDGTGSFDGGHRDQHADWVPGQSVKPAGRNRFNWVNASAFACPGDPSWTVGNPCGTGAGFYPGTNQPLSAHPLPIGRFGNSPVGSVEGPGFFNLSSGLSKTFALTERFKIKAEGTFTNVLNHTNLGDPDLNLSSSSFGLIGGVEGAGTNNPNDFGSARSVQVALRAEF
jgi:hypothetical protein